jgi:adenine-specific DNA-methyltransferase
LPRSTPVPARSPDLDPIFKAGDTLGKIVVPPIRLDLRPGNGHEVPATRDPKMAKRPPEGMEPATKPDTPNGSDSANYEHPNPAVQRPAVGVQQEFPDRRPPKTYRYDSSLAPELAWDESAERELAEWLLGLIEGATVAITRAAGEGASAEAEAAYFAQTPSWVGTGERFGSVAECVARLKSLTGPFLNWAGCYVARPQTRFVARSLA